MVIPSWEVFISVDRRVNIVVLERLAKVVSSFCQASDEVEQVEIRGAMVPANEDEVEQVEIRELLFVEEMTTAWSLVEDSEEVGVVGAIREQTVQERQLLKQEEHVSIVNRRGGGGGGGGGGGRGGGGGGGSRGSSRSTDGRGRGYYVGGGSHHHHSHGVTSCCFNPYPQLFLTIIVLANFI
ncbi:hypothetical protein AgCh_016815 [Apium graveolens]